MPLDVGAKARSHGEELKLAEKLLQESVVRRVRQIGRDGGSPAPWVVELDPTTACNLVCPDCISKDLLNQGGFTNDRLRALAEELVGVGVRAVILIGGGEPLAHPASPSIIEYLDKHAVRVGVTTNGTLIDRHLNCLAEHTSWVRVSVDAGTSETFRHFRPAPNGVSKFNDVIKNMAELAKRKRGKLGYSFLILSDVDRNGEMLRSNISEIFAGAALAKDIGCDYFEVKPSFDFHHFLMAQPEKLLEVARDEIAALGELEDESFRILTPTTLQYVLNNELLTQPKEYTQCPVAQLRTVVTPSGVYVCPYFRGQSNKCLGDVTKSSFAEMWHGERRAEVLKATDPSKNCRFHCIRHQSNLMMERMLSGEDFKDRPDFDLFI
jgi:MoaA/NifB/PqqE/SkfB family radical SAM enzyme